MQSVEKKLNQLIDQYNSKIKITPRDEAALNKCFL